MRMHEIFYHIYETCFFCYILPSRPSIRKKVVPLYLCIKPKLQWEKIFLIYVRKYIKIIVTVLLPNNMESLMNSHIGDLYVVFKWN